MPTEHPQFFTATNLQWKKLLQPDKYKDIIVSSLRFLVEQKRIKLYAFVIMPNHIRLGWCYHQPTTNFAAMPTFITEHPQFFTATNLQWKKLLQPDKYKDIIISSLRFLVEQKRIKLYAFVIMPNHIHLIWQMQPLIHPSHVQRDFLKYTAQQIKFDLMQNHPDILEQFKAGAADRQYQFWERRPLSVELRSENIFLQKLDYIHWNPVRAGFCVLPEDYTYSSALFYHTGKDNWGFLTHYRD